VARVGILGGTFNPPHIGHLVCAQEARHALALDRVLLMPTAVPPHKALPDDPGADRRLAMCRLVAEEDPWLEVSDLEIARGGASWTVDTLQELHAAHPEHELIFIAGGDMAASLPTWRDPSRVLELVSEFAVAEREDDRREHIMAEIADLPGTERVHFFDMPRIDISSRALRARVAEGRPIHHLVPGAVERYIAEEGLYR
jgi:nicotinate-nucleotide adenylyltransferase